MITGFLFLSSNAQDFIEDAPRCIRPRRCLRIPEQ